MIFHKGDVVYQRGLGPFENLRHVQGVMVSNTHFKGGYASHMVRVGRKQYEFHDNEITCVGGARAARVMNKIYEAKHWEREAIKFMAKAFRAYYLAVMARQQRAVDVDRLQHKLKAMREGVI